MAKPIEQDKAKAGEVLREYGKTHFIVCSESLRIGRMKWSIVPIGQKGQNELNFYLPAEKMLALCLDIKNGIAQKKIAADKAFADKLSRNAAEIRYMLSLENTAKKWMELL